MRIHLWNPQLARRDKRQHRQAHQRQPPVDHEHHDHDADQHHQVAYDGHQARADELVESVHVIGESADEAAHRVAVEVRERLVLQVREYLVAQVVHYALPD